MKYLKENANFTFFCGFFNDILKLMIDINTAVIRQIMTRKVQSPLFFIRDGVK